MAIRDRGKQKWHFAFGMPELIKAQRDLWIDQERMKKPIIDEYEKGEFDQRICYAMEYNLPVKVTIWSVGFTSNITGCIHYLDPISHQLEIELQEGEFRRIDFGDVIELSVRHWSWCKFVNLFIAFFMEFSLITNMGIMVKFTHKRWNEL
jgi:hypothetical protein